MPRKDPKQAKAYKEQWKKEHPNYQREYMRKYRAKMTKEELALKRKQDAESQVKFRAEIVAIIDSAKDKPCIDCGIQLPPRAMDLDHVRGEKLFSVGQWGKYRLGGRGKRKQVVLDEIAKCDVRCPSCHRLRHLGLPNVQSFKWSRSIH